MSDERVWRLLQEHGQRQRDLAARRLSRAEQDLQRSIQLLDVLHEYVREQTVKAHRAQADGIPWSPVRSSLAGPFRRQLNQSVQQQEQRIDLNRQGVAHHRAVTQARQQRLKAIEWLLSQRQARERDRQLRREWRELDDWLQAHGEIRDEACPPQ